MYFVDDVVRKTAKAPRRQSASIGNQLAQRIELWSCVDLGDFGQSSPVKEGVTLIRDAGVTTSKDVQ